MLLSKSYTLQIAQVYNSGLLHTVACWASEDIQVYYVV